MNKDKVILDFVLTIDDDEIFPKKIYIEVDGNQHLNPENKRKDRIRESEIRINDFPLLRFGTSDILEYPGWVADVIQGQIETIRG